VIWKRRGHGERSEPIKHRAAGTASASEPIQHRASGAVVESQQSLVAGCP